MDPKDTFPSGDKVGKAENLQDDFELPIEPFQGTPDEIERQWFEKVYKGRGDSMAQLTWRAVIMGSLLGCVLSLTNIYMGLKTGWCFGVAITACILSYAVWNSLFRLGLVRSNMTILENNCMQSTASSAGYSTGGTLISAFAAYMMLNPEPLPIPLTLGWIFFLAVLGVTMAVPMKRQMINIEQLRFPSGIAAAETLRALHSHGEKGMRAARALGIFGVLAAINQFWKDGLQLVHEKLTPFTLDELVTSLNTRVFSKGLLNVKVMFEWDPVFIAAGALTGMRASASMLFGATLCWAVYVPVLEHYGILPHDASWKEAVMWTLWGGVSCMITSGLLAFAMQWRSALRAFSGLGQLFTGKSGHSNREMDRIEVPVSWFLGGQLVALIGLATLAKVTFQMPIWQSVVAVLITFFLALVACRITGETDTTPIGAMGKVTQLIFGGLNPGNMNVNLMSANITAGAASSAADLLTDLKSGYLLGANPRKQFLAQFAGIFSGTIVTVFCFRLMVPSADLLGTKFPAPSALAWMAVAKALSAGISTLGPIKVWSIAIGGLVGILLTVLGKAFPKYEKWVPSPAGIGLAWTFYWSTSLLFFLGAVIGLGWEKTAPKQSKEYLFPVASGIIAGGSLMAVVVIFWQNGPQLIHQLFHH